MLQSTISREKAWLLVILCLSLALRIAIFGQEGHPSGDDSAMQAGFTYVILSQERIPSINPYHMPGTVYTYPPIFHLLTAGLALIDGLPIITTIFLLGIGINIVTALPIYCITKRLWRESAVALTAAYLMVFNFPDLYILCWGGIVTTFTLFLIAILFWFYLKPGNEMKDALSMGILTGALFLSHQLSASIYAVIATTCIFIWLVTKKRAETSQLFMPKKLLISLGIGVIIATNWVISKLASYIAIFRSTEILQEEITMALSKLVLGVPEIFSIVGVVVILLLFIITGLYSLHRELGSWTNPKSVLMLTWILIPLIFITASMFGVAVYYQRYLYFINHPLVIAITGGLVYLTLKAYSDPNRHKRVAASLVIGGLLFANAAGTAIITNNLYGGYLTVNEQDLSSVAWINRYTLDGTVVTTHSLGWWTAGLAHRPTLASSALVYLTYPSEVDLVQTADFILTANYDLENGVIRARESGPYFFEYNPIFYMLRKSIAYRAIYFSDEDTHILFQKEGTLTKASLGDRNILPTRTVTWIARNENLTAVTTLYASSNIQVSKRLVVQRGTCYATMTYHVTASNKDYKILGLIITAHFDQVDKPTVGKRLIGTLNLKLKAGVNILSEQDITLTSITGDTAQFVVSGEDAEIHVVLFDVETLTTDQASREVQRYSDINFVIRPNPLWAKTPVTSIDCTEAIKLYAVQYILCTQKSADKLLYDPRFELVYFNGQNYLFKVKR